MPSSSEPRSTSRMSRMSRWSSAFRSWRLRRHCLAAIETARRAGRCTVQDQTVAFGAVVIDASVECAELSGTGGRVVSVATTAPNTVLVSVEFDEAHVVLISPSGIARHAAASVVRLPFTVRDDETRRKLLAATMELSLSGVPVDVTAQYRFAPNELVAATLTSSMMCLTIAVPCATVGNGIGPAS